MYEVSEERFVEMVQDALDGLPEDLAKRMENVAVFVEDHASGRSLFGLYEGIPLTRRSPLSYSGTTPDRITLYQGTICAHCSSEEAVRAQVRKTLVHEVAHHFGIEDERLHELGWG